MERWRDGEVEEVEWWRGREIERWRDSGVMR